MTNEEAIEIIKQDIPCEHDTDLIEALDVAIKALEQQPCDDAISRHAVLEKAINVPIAQIVTEDKVICRKIVFVDDIENMPPVTPKQKYGKWIPVSERLPELNRPLLVTSYHRVYYGYLISESGNYGYPVFRIHGLGDKNRDWVQETMSHEPYSLGRIDAWMYLDIPEPYKVEPQESEG